MIHMAGTKMLHVRLPTRLIEELDSLCGPRSRSQVMAEALEEYLRRRRLLQTIRRHKGSLSPAEHAVWSSSEAVDAWVRALRGSGEACGST